MVAASGTGLDDVLAQIAVDMSGGQMLGLRNGFEDFRQDRLEQIVDHPCFVIGGMGNRVGIEIAVENLISIAGACTQVEHSDPPGQHVAPLRSGSSTSSPFMSKR